MTATTAGPGALTSCMLARGGSEGAAGAPRRVFHAPPAKCVNGNSPLPAGQNRAWYAAIATPVVPSHATPVGIVAGRAW